MGARREVVAAVTERYWSAKRAEKGRMLDALCATTGWHRKHAVRALRQRESNVPCHWPDILQFETAPDTGVHCCRHHRRIVAPHASTR